MDDQLVWAISGEFFEHFVAGAEGLHGVEGVDAIFAGQEIADAAEAVSQATENGGAVGNTLVPRHAEFGME